MIRSAKLSIKYLTKAKHNKLQALISRYRSAVNWYINYLWNKNNNLDKDTYKLITNCKLNAPFKQMALKQAKEMVFGVKRQAKKQHKSVSKPHFSGNLVLDQRVININLDNPNSFDCWIRCSTLKHKGRIDLPLKRTKVLNKWLAKPGAELRKSICLNNKWIKLFIEIPELVGNSNTKVLGIDLGINKTISDSDGNHYGREFKKLSNRIRNRKFKSATRTKILRARDNYLNWAVNQLPWNEIKALGIEDLKNLKKGMGKRTKAFRKAMAPWTYRQVLSRIEQKAQEHCVQLVKVNPAYTSQTCPSCQLVSKENRCGEYFACQLCGYQDDADTVGAKNVMKRTLETLGCL